MDTAEKNLLSDHEHKQEENILCNIKRHKTLSILVSIGICVIAILLVVFLTTNNETSNKNSSSNKNDNDNSYLAQEQDEAANNIESLLTNVTDYVTQTYELYKSNNDIIGFFNTSLSLSQDENDTISNAFDIFDINNDGYWNLSEYETFSLALGIETKVFSNMDIDNDNVVSFREAIVTLKNQETLSNAKYVYDNLLGPSVAHVYNVSRYIEETNDDENNDDDDEQNESIISDTWHEYAADLIMSNYDPGYKGFFTIDDYYNTEISSKFSLIDSNNDSMITLIEYINATFNFDKLKYATVHNIINVNSTKKEHLGSNFVGYYGIARSNDAELHSIMSNESISYCPNMNRHGVRSGKQLHEILNPDANNKEYGGIDDDLRRRRRRRLGWLDWYYDLACAWNVFECGSSIAFTCATAGAAIGSSIYYCSTAVYDCYEAIS